MADIELPLLKVLASMQIEGFFVDTEKLKKYGEDLDIRINSLKDSITFMAGEDFNINSPKQLGTVLFEHMGIPARQEDKERLFDGLGCFERAFREIPDSGRGDRIPPPHQA